MNRATQFFLGLILLANGIATPLTAADSAEPPRLADSIKAVVNDVPITQQQLVLFMGRDEENLYQQYRYQPEVYNRKVSELRESASEYLVAREVILHEFKTSIKLPESILDEEVDERLKDKYPDHIALTRQLQAEGTTLEQLRQKIRDQFIVEQMSFTFVKQPIISPLKIENYYSTHTPDFKQDDQIKMRMIVLNRPTDDSSGATRKRAEEILSQIKGGAKFDEMAKTYSDGSQRLEGGETGWEDFSAVNKTLAAELDKIKPGQYTGVIELPASFYILLLEERHPAHIRPLGEVRAQIEKTLSSQETERLRRQWMERLKKKTYIKYF